MNLKMMTAAVLTPLFLIILAQNAQVVTLRLLFWKFSMSQIILLLFAALVGFLGGYLVAKMGARRR